MPTLNKSAIVPHPREMMFDLVDRVEAYPEFLPWCSGVDLLERTTEVTSARIEISWRGLEARVATRNAKRPPEAMDLELLEGPFESFRGTWRFASLGEGGCRVEFSLRYAFESRALELALGPLFSQIMGSVVDRFVARADALAAR
jgi:ribosome-associated toxin RatA of RatAB toxin-antitoxin module